MPHIHTLQARLIVIMCTFLALTLGALGFFINQFNTRAIIEQNRSREALFVRNVEVSINQVLFAGKYQAQAYIEALDKGEPSLRYVSIIEGTSRRAIADSDPRRIGTRFDDPATTQALTAMQTGQVVFQTVELPDGEVVNDWAVPYVRGYLRDREGVIRIGISGDREQMLIRQSRLYTFALIALFLVAGAMLAVALSVRLTAGLRSLTAGARLFGEGDYQARVSVPATPRDELDELGVAFNRMASQLQGYAEGLEAQVRTSEVRLRGFIDHANAAIYMKDLDGRYLIVNRVFEELACRERRFCLGQTDAEIFGPEVGALVRRRDLDVIESGRPIEVEEAMTLDKGPSVFLTIKFPLKDDTGRVYAVGGVSTDITERKRLESTLQDQYNKLKQLDKLKDEFVNAVSHDLRTPLTSILGYAEFLEDEIGGAMTPEQLEFVNQIQKGARRLEGLVDDLLDFARIEAGTFRLRKTPGDLRDPVTEIVESLRPQAEENGQQLTLRVPEAPLVASLDERRIQQVVTNLLHNAIKFTPRGGEIVVKACATADRVRFEVCDTGPGIAPEDVKRLFQRFSQLQVGMAKGGTGLGLSISKSIVEAHGGAIGVDSTPGEGATFWFTLPTDLPKEA